MKTLTVRVLRCDFAKVGAWLADRQEIGITKHGKPVARPAGGAPIFDAEARMRRLSESRGDRVSTTEEVREAGRGVRSERPI